MGTFAAAGIVLIAPWTNNGINVLGVLFALLAGFWAFISSWEERYKIMKDGEAVATGMLFASLLIVPLELWEMDSVI
jgi:inner membrane transporter RhtA